MTNSRSRSSEGAEEGAQSRPDLKSSSLSEERLAQHNARERSPNPRFAQDRIREEQARIFNQDLYTYVKADDRSQRSGNEDTGEASKRRQDPSLQSSLALYQQAKETTQPDDTLPIGRFATIGGANETHPLLAKREMAKMHLRLGDMETAQSRTYAAEESTKSLQNRKRTMSETTNVEISESSKRGRQDESSDHDTDGDV
ncbi:MAG: hypothetical protein M1820_004039 [Bogoriella megaspora]|nr:MAG: hypothetical protein M1820_004039 [Bogoriella megaspora]